MFPSGELVARPIHNLAELGSTHVCLWASACQRNRSAGQIAPLDSALVHSVLCSQRSRFMSWQNKSAHTPNAAAKSLATSFAGKSTGVASFCSGALSDSVGSGGALGATSQFSALFMAVDEDDAAPMSFVICFSSESVGDMSSAPFALVVTNVSSCVSSTVISAGAASQLE